MADRGHGPREAIQITGSPSLTTRAAHCFHNANQAAINSLDALASQIYTFTIGKLPEKCIKHTPTTFGMSKFPFSDSLLEGLPLGIVFQNGQGQIMAANISAQKMLGLSLDQMRGVTSVDPRWQTIREDGSPFPGEEHPSMVALRTRTSITGVVMGVFNPERDAHVWIKITATLAGTTSEGDLAGVYTLFEDVTERKAAEEAQRIAATAFESQQGLFITDAKKVILRVNKAFIEITGYTAADAVGQTPALFKSGHQDAAFYAAMWGSIERTGAWEGEIWNRRKDGAVYPERLRISTVKSDAGVLTHYVGAFSDLASQKATEEQIYDLAYTDQLTGLPNRVMLIIRLQQAGIAAEKQNQRGALLLVDLDQFKNLNDTLGHEAGDEVLKCIAKRLSELLRHESNTVARLGGDEFAVLLDHLSPDPQTALRQAETMTHKILEALNQPYQLAKTQASCTVSIGVTFLYEKGDQAMESLKRAELAMFQAKSAGRNTSRFFDPQMQDIINTRVALEAALREAIEQQQFTLYYQAQVSDSKGIVGVEALLRWNDPKRGSVSPAEFIPLAEETGLILPIGAWVLETACQQLAIWADQPSMEHLSVAVNVSARQFRESNFARQVLTTLERTGANAQRLKLELTESILVADVEDVIAKMKALKASGIGFAIDDFGTGYSSLSYLKRLPLERLKIDQGFVRNILMDADDAAIARAVIAMAVSMGLGVIAEGVETAAQRDFLADLGCHNFQGYLFGRPVPVAEFEALMRRG